MHTYTDQRESVVITGIGMITSLGADREGVWRAVQQGKSGIRSLAGLPGMPASLRVGAPVLLPEQDGNQLKVIRLSLQTAAEAVADAGLDLAEERPERCGCAISGHVGDTTHMHTIVRHPQVLAAPPGQTPWWEQFLPNTACCVVANQFGLNGPRLSHSVACASGLVDILAAARAIEDGQCDVALAGSSEAIHPLFAAGFTQMRALSTHEDPEQACRPFDTGRTGFVMGEGGAMFVLESLSHAMKRGARIYAEIGGSAVLAEAHHVTGLDMESETLSRAIGLALRHAHLRPCDVGYINAHGTGTLQNDVNEVRGIRRAFGEDAENTWVSASKSMLGHLLTASGPVELALTVLALRDGFAPPTLNLTSPDPECNLDCLPLVGRTMRHQAALKISVAFGGHVVAVALRRWSDAASGFEYPSVDVAEAA